MENNIIGPFLFGKHTVTGEKLLALTEHFSAITFLQNSFQLGGAPPQFSHNVCAFLDSEFPKCWIRRGGLIPWFSRSYFLQFVLFWGFVEKHCLQRKMQNMNEFHERTVTAAECFTNEVLSSTW
jgi:hypothetical protein